MEKDYISELLRLFLDFDTKKHWNVGPDEAVQVLLDGEEEYLFSNNLEDFVDVKLGAFEALANERGGIYGSVPLRIGEIYELLRYSPNAQKRFEKKHTDLSHAAEIELSDGHKIPINQNIPRNNK